MNSEQIMSATGAAQEGDIARPLKTTRSDGPVATAPNLNPRLTTTKRFTVSGTTWMNNLTNTLFTGTEGTPTITSGACVSFPWEFDSLWVGVQDSINILNEWMWYKPKSVSVVIANARAWTQMQTGATPNMIPISNSRLIGGLDINYQLPLDTCVFGLGSPQSVNANGAITDQVVQAWLDSTQNHGYSVPSSGLVSSTQIFMPNSFTQYDNPVGEPGELGTEMPTSFGSEQGASKHISMGDGHEMAFHWDFNNRYWRTTEKICIYPQIIVNNATLAPASLPNGIMQPRLDETFGEVKWSGTTGSSDFFARMNQQSWELPNESGLPWYMAQVAPSQAYTVPVIEENPQPRLLLQLRPDTGTFGVVASVICQLNFKVTVTYEVQGRYNQVGKGSWREQKNFPTGTNAPFVVGPPRNTNFSYDRPSYWPILVR